MKRRVAKLLKKYDVWQEALHYGEYWKKNVRDPMYKEFLDICEWYKNE